MNTDSLDNEIIAHNFNMPLHTDRPLSFLEALFFTVNSSIAVIFCAAIAFGVYWGFRKIIRSTILMA